MATCTEGHTSTAGDYCDVCGSSIEGAPAPPPKTCPACGVPGTGRFCEACGHDSALPQPVPPAPPAGAAADWVAVVNADRDFYERVLARGGPDTVEFPQFFPERRITLRDNTLIGRRNRAQGVDPAIDLGIHPVDRGVSTQHAVLRFHDASLTVTDLGSTNGTTLNECDDRLGYGEEVPLVDGDRIHVGAWTTITIRQAAHPSGTGEEEP